MRFITCMALCLLALAGSFADEAPKLKLSMVPPKGPVAGVWISDGYAKEDLHITTESNGFVIGRNPAFPGFKFTDPALIFEKDGVRLQLKGEDGQAVSRPVPLRLARKLLDDMLSAAVKATEPAKQSTKEPASGLGERTAVCPHCKGARALMAGRGGLAGGRYGAGWYTCQVCSGTGKVAAAKPCPCGDGKSLCSCGPACDCDSDYWTTSVRIRR